MRIKLECLPCIFRQTVEAGRMATEDEDLIKEIMDEYAQMIPGFSLNELSPAIVTGIQEIIKEKTGVADPYREFKEKHIQLALDLYPEVKQIIEDADKAIVGALIMAATGNSIDAGVKLDINIDESIKDAIENGFTCSDFDRFQDRIEKGGSLLIIGDNCGEAVFDKLLIEELNNYDVDITYAVREAPVLNDITMKEAKEIGLDKVCTVISSSCKTPGTILSKTSEEFMKVYRNADIIISKGQGNLEGLSETEGEIFFLLKAKCKVIANLLDVNVGALVFKLFADNG